MCTSNERLRCLAAPRGLPCSLTLAPFVDLKLTYVKKMVERFLPDGASNRIQNASLPYSQDFLKQR